MAKAKKKLNDDQLSAATGGTAQKMGRDAVVVEPNNAGQDRKGPEYSDEQWEKDLAQAQSDRANGTGK